MFEQVIDGMRKASEASIAAQQETMKQWVQQWPATPLTSAQDAVEGTRALQKRWIETATESMTKQRELIDSACRAGIELMQQAGQLVDAKTTEDFRHQLEELWRKAFEVMKTQSEAQFEQLMRVSQAWMQPPQAR
jgi:hypothetical protein